MVSLEELKAQCIAIGIKPYGSKMQMTERINKKKKDLLNIETAKEIEKDEAIKNYF